MQTLVRTLPARCPLPFQRRDSKGKVEPAGGGREEMVGVRGWLKSGEVGEVVRRREGQPGAVWLTRASSAAQSPCTQITTAVHMSIIRLCAFSRDRDSPANI